MKQPLVLGGRYRVLERVGSGGMADVFLAEQVSLGRKVALKVLKRSLLETDDMVARFKREALLLSTVNHPNVVRVLDFDAGVDGNVLVLEYVEGARLDSAMRDGPFELDRAMRLLLQLAEGLAAIHALNIVHRDFKPENIVLGQGARGEEARVLDFGVARFFEEPTATDERAFVTQQGVGAGTPAYMSPEQIRGSPPDPRADVYAFGVTAYRMLAGVLPFPGPTSDAFMKQHLEITPPRLGTVVPRLAAEAPELVALVHRCLEKSPAARPADGRELATELAALQSGGAPRPSKGRFWPRLGWAVAWSLSLGAGLVPVVVASRPWLPSSQARWLLEQGHPEWALHRLKATLQLDVEDPARWAMQARALEATGAEAEVRSMLSTACYRALIPGGAELVQRLAPMLTGDSEGAACLTRATSVPTAP